MTKKEFLSIPFPPPPGGVTLGKGPSCTYNESRHYRNAANSTLDVWLTADGLINITAWDARRAQNYMLVYNMQPLAGGEYAGLISGNNYDIPFPQCLEQIVPGWLVDGILPDLVPPVADTPTDTDGTDPLLGTSITVGEAMARMTGLPPICGAMYLHIQEAGYNVPELSDRFGIAISTVCTYAVRMRKALKKSITA